MCRGFCDASFDQQHDAYVHDDALAGLCLVRACVMIEL